MAQTVKLTAKPGSYVMITGAAGGLGKAFAVECASRGWNLVLTDLRADALEPWSFPEHHIWHQCRCSLRFDRSASRAVLFDGSSLGPVVLGAGERGWNGYEGLFFECTRTQIAPSCA
jgi:NAD(P)-dependent dehydrogenase (short-subunit alcohol dehydrogenase family)